MSGIKLHSGNAGVLSDERTRFILRDMDSNGYSTWLEIDLGAIQTNVRRLLELTGTPMMAVVKADGYGHGASAVAQAAVSAGATWVGVARLEEALALRQMGLTSKILVLGYTSAERIPDAIAHQISVTIYDAQVGEAYAARAKALGGILKVQLKVDTGMGRLGVTPEQAVEFLRWIQTQQGLEAEGIFTHFARADEPDAPTTLEQLRRFNDLLTTLDAMGLCPPIKHAANSAAALNFPASRFDLIRPGIALYGMQPSGQSPLPEGFRPALSWKTRLTSVKMLPAGHGVSYGHVYRTRTTERIGSIAVGYADGFRLMAPNEVLVNGKRASVVGRVCMDQSMVQLDHLPLARIGDEVVLIGSQGDQTISAEEVAKRWQTITYEVICGLATRIPRIYCNNQNS